jgi:hypothetical protein
MTAPTASFGSMVATGSTAFQFMTVAVLISILIAVLGAEQICRSIRHRDFQNKALAARLIQDIQKVFGNRVTTNYHDVTVEIETISNAESARGYRGDNINRLERK